MAFVAATNGEFINIEAKCRFHSCCINNSSRWRSVSCRYVQFCDPHPAEPQLQNDVAYPPKPANSGGKLKPSHCLFSQLIAFVNQLVCQNGFCGRERER